MSKIVLFGTGRGADVAYRFLTADTDHEIVGFAVDDAHRTSSELRGLPVVSFEEVERHYPPDEVRMFILLGYQGMNALRRDKFNAAKAKGYTLESYVASGIFQAEPIRRGENCFILDNQSISLDVEIGDNVVMWSSNHVGDLTVVESHAWISSHVTIAASVRVGEGAFLGIGATVSNNVVIGKASFVGAHVFVSGDVQPDTVMLSGKDAEGIGARQFMRMMIAGGKL